MILMSSPSLISFMDKGKDMTWYSPLENENHKEYRNEFLDLEDDWKKAKSQMKDYWPAQGPRWDGIAMVRGKDGRKGLLLVEAKAHVKEMRSKIKATDSQSVDLIERTIRETKAGFGSESLMHTWLNQYYQLSNRLAYLYILNEKMKIPTWLALVNFVDDESLGKETSLDQWLDHYQEVFADMNIKFDSSSLLNRLVTIFPKGLKG
ncbi:hypothetical protein CEH05_02495 [Halobacillus halophilus]|uniref:Uncharacterized protein n=3 Tax=Halobacillus halophilus TaxID=1570 RepID=I0JI71_HALH3|nr:hypothetical protein CEH05_02495 [Halobacillus halophilus]CCG43839.1 hypothetical protein HBHAL_1467 [Halobacillus halophilus DSM 2266]